jgi:S1-C subfamily serine protease
MLGFLLAAWVTVLPQVGPSVVRVEIQKGDKNGVCTAVVLRVQDDYALAASAAHCYDKQPTERIDIAIDGRNVVVVAANSILDVALIRFRARKEKAIVTALTSPAAGTPVSILGYAFGAEKIYAQYGHVALNDDDDKKWLVIDGMIINGDSGGALIDAEGRLIGINSHYQNNGLGGQSTHLAGIVKIEAVQDFLADFDDEQAKKKR